MRLLSLTVAHFGKLKQFTLTPEDGLNCYCHPNEFGKTTLIHFIYFMFYGYDARLLKGYFPWDGEPLSGSLTFQSEEGSFRIERMHPLKGSGKRRLLQLETGGEWMLAAKEQPGPLFFGLDGETFLNTFCITQGNLLFARTEGLDVALKNLATTGDENASFQKAENDLQKQHTQYMHRGKTQGKLLDLEVSLQQDQAALQGIRRRVAETIDQKQRGDRLHAELARLQEQRSLLEQQLERARKSDALKRLKQLEALEHAGAQGERMPPVPKEELARLARCFAQAEEAERDRTRAEEEQRYAADQLQLLRDHLQSFGFHALSQGELDALKKGWKKSWRTAGLLLLASSLPAAALSVWLYPPLLVFAALLVLTGALLLLARIATRSRLLRAYGAGSPDQLLERWAQYQQTKQREAQQKTLYEAAAQKAREAFLRAQTALEEQKALQTRYRILEKEELDSIKIQWGIYESRLQTKEEANRQIALLLGDWTRERLQKMAEGAEPAAETAEQIFRQIRQLEQRREQLALELEEQNPAGLAALWQQLNRLERAIKEKEAKVLLWRKNLNAIQQALLWLKQANEEMNTQFSPKLCAKAGQYLSEMTNGKYRELLLDDQYGIRVKTGAGTFPVTAFSGGTQDGVYFAFRLAVGDLLSSTALPMVLDDPFVNLDPLRKEAAMTLLRQAGKQRQILYFTCHS